jgi:pimeloyl-ACP methyl ester carboxylesterase
MKLPRLRRARQPLAPRHVHFVATRDGWRIALHRYPAPPGSARRDPVFLCHGLGSNRFDLDAPHASLAQYLNRAGFDAWVVELRGGGQSSRPRWYNRLRYDWNFDDYLYHDLPAALSFIHHETGRPKVHWVGHSMGGMLAYAYLAIWNDHSVRSVVTAGSPSFSRIERPILDTLLTVHRAARPIRRVPNRALGHLASLAPRLARDTVGQLLLNPRHVSAVEVRSLLRLAVEDIPLTLIDQFASWYHRKEFRLSYGTFDFREALRHIRTPILVIAGARDWLTPPEDLRLVYEQLGSPDKSFIVAGKDHGFSENYGHVDLILGNRAESEIYPHVLAWLERCEG